MSRVKRCIIYTMFILCISLTACGSGDSEKKSANSAVSIEAVNMDISLLTGDTFKLEYKSEDGVIEPDKLVFETSDDSIALVDGDGNVKGIKAGKAIVTATYDKGSDCSWIISVYDDFSIISEKNEVGIIEGDSLKLSYEVSGGLPEEKSEVTFDVLDDDIVSVSEDGYISALKIGKTKVYAKIKETTFEWKVTVYEQYEVTAKKDTIKMEKDGSKDLSDMVSCTGGIPGEEVAFSYKSDNKKICTVDENGKVSGKKPGTAKVAITCGNSKPFYVTVNVLKKAYIDSGISEYTDRIYEGDSFKLQYVTHGGDKSYKLKFTSKNKKIATVTKNGTVKCHKPGTTKIIGEYGDSTFTWKVTVQSTTIIMKLKDGYYSFYGKYNQLRFKDMVDKKVKDRNYYEIYNDEHHVSMIPFHNGYEDGEVEIEDYEVKDVFKTASQLRDDMGRMKNVSYKKGFLCIKNGKLTYKIKMAKELYYGGYGEFTDYSVNWEGYRLITDDNSISEYVGDWTFRGIDIKDGEITCIVYSP